MPIPILMPALSPTMEEGTLAKWHVKEGDTVAPGDVIAEIETDKATMEVEAVDEGTVGKILIAEGTDAVKVNTPIMMLLEEGESPDAAAAAPVQVNAAPAVAAPAVQASAPSPSPQMPASAGPVPQAGHSAPATMGGGRVLASPLARRIAAQANLPLAAILGTGPNGRIVKKDVEAALAGGAAVGGGTVVQMPAAAPAAPAPTLPTGMEPIAVQGEGSNVKLSNMRKTIARRLTDAKRDVPHYYLTIDCLLDELLRVRKRINDRAGEASDGIKISVNDFVIRASAKALMAVPEVRSSWAGDRLFLHDNADVGIAVAIEGGLITPIIRSAQNKGLADIAREAKSLAERARDKKLKPEEYEGGSFSISNLGMFGIRQFTAVINPPHSAILAVGAGESRPVVKPDGTLGVATVMTCTLSCDHRVIDGAVGAQFLKLFKGFIEDPATMLA